jgi:hypothetical protein
MWVGLQHATGARARVVGRRLVSLGGACRLLPARVLSKRGQGPHQSPFHRGRGGSRPAASSPSTGQVTVRTRGAFPVKDARVQAGGGHAFGDALAIPGLLAWRPPHRHELIEIGVLHTQLPCCLGSRVRSHCQLAGTITLAIERGHCWPVVTSRGLCRLRIRTRSTHTGSCRATDF